MKGGGLMMASSAPAAATNERVATAQAVARPGRRRTSHTIRASAAAIAVTVDHRSGVPHAPNHPEAVPNRVHGNTVATIRTRSAAPVARHHTGIGVLPASSGRASAATSGGRHSGPRTVPRTGTAHAMQSVRPQLAHRATEGDPGWSRHRSALFAISTGIAEA